MISVIPLLYLGLMVYSVVRSRGTGRSHHGTRRCRVHFNHSRLRDVDARTFSPEIRDRFVGLPIKAVKPSPRVVAASSDADETQVLLTF
jgi:hypothetical protein